MEKNLSSSELILKEDCSPNMKKYFLSEIGKFHTNHNEDAFVIEEIGKNKILIAVMDGCSMGKESHFASTLMAKLLRKIAKEIGYKAFIEKTEKTAGEHLKEVMNQLFLEMRQIKNQLLLERDEVLSTLILGVLDEAEKALELIVIGDGLVCNNGEFHEYEQDDQPDYLGYHLAERFKHWFQGQTQKLTLKNIKDISISTDGIFTFKNFDGKEYAKISDEEIVEFLLISEKWENQANMLNRKLIEIEDEFGLKPSDDLTIIRIIMD